MESNTLGTARVSGEAGGAARSRWMVVFYVAVLGVIWFSSIGVRALISPDEGRYATLSLGMLQSGDWVTPRLNGILYFEKPVLQYWLGAFAFWAFGVSEFSARLWPVLAGFITVLATGFTAARLWGREAGLVALAVCASMTWILGNSFYLTLDAGLALWLTLSLCAMLLAHRGGLPAEARRNWVLLAWAAMALAVLTKGLVGILIPGTTLVLLCLWQRDWSWWRGMHWLPGTLLLLAIAAPWFVVVSLRNPAFPGFFFVHEHFARFLTTVHQREGAWWYYVPLLLAGTLPWTGLLAWLAFKRQVQAKDAPGAPGAGALRTTQARVLLVWSGFVFLFFSMSGSKLPSYILPMFPALALLVGLRLRDLSLTAMRWHVGVPALVWLLAVIASTQVHRFASEHSPMAVVEPMAHAIRAGAAVFLAGAAIAWFCLYRGRLVPAIQWLALGHVVAMVIVFTSHNGFGQLKSSVGIAEALAPYLDARTPVYALRTYDQTLPFYLRRNVVLVDYVDEFELGQRLEPGVSIDRLDDFIAQWNGLSKGAAYMSLATFQELQQRGVPMRVVYRDPRRLMVVKP